MTENKNLEEFKKELIANIDGRVQNKIIEQANADLLKKLINQAETETEAINIAALGTTYKRTGFHFDKRLEKISNDIKYKVKNEKLSFVNDASRQTHELIIGDNYDALQNLLITYKGKIDVIYIDPPYGKDSMGEFAKTNYDNSITRDNLLSMFYSRLLLAKRLLSEDGVIFCSIDDKNQAYVKCLFDEVFGEENLLGTLVWQSATDNNVRQITTEHEYIHAFAKIKSNQDKWLIDSEKAQMIKRKYEELKESLGTDITNETIQIELRKWIVENEKELKGVAHYNCVDEKGVFTANTNSSNTKPGGYMFDIIHPVTKKVCTKPDYGWRWTEDTFLKYASEGNVLWGKDETTQPHIKKRIETVTEQLKGIYYEDGRVATKLLESIFGNKLMFSNPKPITFIKRLIEFCSRKNSIILDFFAGSGTTGQAVMELNRQDDGDRMFILCQLNEKTKDNPNGIAYDVTTKRLKRIMSGECYDGSKDFPWLKDNEPYMDNLNVYKIGKVSKTEHQTGETAFDKIDETCYGLPKFEKLTDKIEWVCQNFENATKMEE